jgi:alpha-tubulin suppressor-like RCC1 family protein
MSMPNFPELPDLTREDVLNQIVTSVAYEELALSHILNAEGEKIQWALGTLPDSPSARKAAPSNPTIDDVLDINDSVGSMLDTVLDNQMILSSKLTAALSAQTAVGVCGTTGAEGAQGGTTGETGPAGTNGALGATGPQGALGATGLQGEIGPQGPKSLPRGATGAVGEIGATGATGLQGAIGATGAAPPIDPPTLTHACSWTTTTKTLVTFTEFFWALALQMDESISHALDFVYDTYSNPVWDSYHLELSSPGYFLISYRIVLDEARNGYSGVGYTFEPDNMSEMIPASIVDANAAQLSVFEKRFIARFEDSLILYLELMSGRLNIDTAAPGGVVFTAMKLKNVNISFTQTATTTLDVGAVCTQAELVTVTTNPPGQTVTWSSSDENVATVDENGNVTAVGAGEVTITGKIADGETLSYMLEILENSSTSLAPAIVAGDLFSAVLTPDGTVWAWGNNGYGQLGDGTTTQRSTPAQVQNLSDVTAIASTNNFILALKTDGTISAWGAGSNYQLGNGNYSNQSLPVNTLNMSDVTAIAAGSGHSLALKSNGTLWAWGFNNKGQLGDGTTQTRTAPIQVPLSDVIAMAADGTFSLAVKSDGTVWAWGQNFYGGLGNGTTTDSSTPVQVLDLDNVTHVAARNASSFALKSDGTVWGWGYNSYGRLGDGTTENRSTRVQVLGLEDIIAIAEGTSHTMALKSDGTVWAWGGNNAGKLGNDTTTDSATPVQADITDVIAIAAGDYHSSAIKADGTVWSWGSNGNAQLGIGTTGSYMKTPVQVVGEGGEGWLNL